MSRILKYADPDQLQPNTKQWIQKVGFEHQGNGVWSKKTNYFIRADGTKPDVELIGYLDDSGVSFDMRIQGSGRHYSLEVAVSGVGELQLTRTGTGIEHKLCDAWNDLNS